MPFHGEDTPARAHPVRAGPCPSAQRVPVRKGGGTRPRRSSSRKACADAHRISEDGMDPRGERKSTTGGLLHVGRRRVPRRGRATRTGGRHPLRGLPFPAVRTESDPAWRAIRRGADTPTRGRRGTTRLVTRTEEAVAGTSPTAENRWGAKRKRMGRNRSSIGMGHTLPIRTGHVPRIRVRVSSAVPER